MSTRAELEAELKETQELEHYMKTLLDDRIRQCEQLEYTNAALTKRVAELDATTRERLIRVRELEHETMSWSEKVDTETYWQTGLRELEIQNAGLTKRVAELEAELRRRAELYTSNETVLRQMHDDLQWHIRNLQSQLAWTPVSAGLPEVDRTTCAVLVVHDAHGGGMLLEPRYHEDGEWRWCSPEFPFGIKFGEGCTWEYRRIELPEAAVEYHAQGDVPKAVLDIIQEQYSKLPKDGET